MSKTRFYRASDYAGIEFDGGSFYYGYERTDGNGEWCFVAKIGIVETVTPFSKLGTKDMFNVAECLCVGLGHFVHAMVNNLSGRG